MTKTITFKTLITFLVIALMLPMMSFAHEPHPEGTPAHPIGSADYHPIGTANVSSSEDTNALQTKLALLLQLVALLQQKLALITGDTSGSDTVSSSVNTVTDITTIGDLVMTTDDTYRYFTSDGLPEYSVGGNNYAHDPTAQNLSYRVPLNPVKNSAATYYNIPYTFGIALNGVTFEPFAAEWYQNDSNSGWQEDPFVTLRDLDDYNAHVQPTGLYHYHGQPMSLVDGGNNTHSSLIGFAGDGFPVYGPYVYEDADDSSSDIVEVDSQYSLKSGTRPSGPGGRYDGTYNEDYEYNAGDVNDLDECNGRYGVTPEYPDGTYYYVLTESFPYIPRCLMGDQDTSFEIIPRR